LRRDKPSAIVCHMSGLEPDSIAELARFQEEGGVLVTFDHSCDLECDQIVVDEEENAYRAASYLLGLGHRRLGLCAVSPVPLAGPRRLGFERGFERA
jgi:LacI family transcriptional regulator